MNKTNRMLRALLTAMLAAAMAGSGAMVLSAAAGASLPPLTAYLSAMSLAALCALGMLSGPASLAALAAGVAGVGAYVWMHRGGLGQAAAQLLAWIRQTGEQTPEATAQAVRAALPLLAALSAAALFGMLRQEGGSAFALIAHAAVLIVCCALNEEMPFGPAVPGLIAAAAAFAMSAGLPGEGAAWRALPAAALAVAVALLATPSGHPTWAPLRDAAQLVRSVFEDYFQFTEERIPYTITAEGYNHAVEEDGAVVARLGGPADPSEEEVMRVTCDAPVLLRGTIRRTYTGRTWIDPDAKARYLYIDPTRRGARSDLLGMHDNRAFAPVSVRVEFLSETTSALFVPSRLESFDMDLRNAVYFNSIGEMFLSRPLTAGDSYTLKGYGTFGSEEAVRAAVNAAAGRRDEAYIEQLTLCTQLPDGIEQGVYQLTQELVSGIDDPYGQAQAIEAWLRLNCSYTLTPDLPDANRDFVSQFVLSTRSGYCSYFASAMTVMCRIAGLPARYVEGYAVREGTTLVTGANAHAWTEVYFNGIGWVSFDPTSGSGGYQESQAEPTGTADASQSEHSGDPANDREGGQQGDAPTPTPDPQGSDNSGGSDNPGNADNSEGSGGSEGGAESTPTPPPEGGSDSDGAQSTPTPPPQQPMDTPTPPPEDAQTPPDSQNDNDPPRHHWLLWLILLLIALIAAAVMWLRRRLWKTDPLRISAEAKDDHEAALILYRAILTLLRHSGQMPTGTETPGAFARRVCAGRSDAPFVPFADAIARSAYARGTIGANAVKTGRAAYAQFLAGMRRGDRMRYAVTRITRGIGSWEQIP